MKKITLFTAFVAALFFASCVKETPKAPAAPERVQFHAMETKTVFTAPEGTSYPVLWTANDSKVAVTMNYATSHVAADVTRSADDKTATFSAEFDTAGETEYAFQVVSPESAVKSINKTNKTFNLEIPTSQTCTAGSPDENAMILYATTAAETTFPKNLNVTFQHFTGYLHLVFTNYDAIATAGATVNSVSISSAKGIAGRRFLWSNGDVTVNTSAQVVTVATSSLDDVWAGLAPVDLSSETLSFTVSTDKGTLTKEVTLPADRNLTSGKIAKITVDMSGVALVEPVQYDLVTDAAQLNVGDKIIIAAANYDRALSTTQKSNNRDATAITKGAGFILDPSSAVEIIELEDGYVPGEFALKASAGYLYAAGGSSSNYLRTAAPADINDSTAPLGSWEIQIQSGQDNGTGDGLHEPAEGTTDNVATIHAKAVDRGYLFYNGSGSNNLFSAYAGIASYTSYLQIYRLHNQPVAKHFKVVVPGADNTGKVAVAAAGGALAVKVFGNVAWTASASGVGNLNVTSGTGPATLTLTIPQNTDPVNTRDITLTVSTTEAVTPDEYEFTLTQAAQPTPAVFPIIWDLTDIATNGVADTDYHLQANSQNGSYVYTSSHSGKLFPYRTSSSGVSGKNPTLKVRSDAKDVDGTTDLNEGMFLHYGIGQNDYWEFDVYNVKNLAGTYRITFKMCSSASGARHFRIEYTLEDEWPATPDVATSDSGSGTYESTAYSFAITQTNVAVQADAHFHLPAMSDFKTLKVRAIVVTGIRCSGSTGLSNNTTATNRMLGTPTITFTAD